VSLFTELMLFIMLDFSNNELWSTNLDIAY